MIYLFVVLVVFAYLFISGDSARAAIPNSARIIPFQGVLTNSSGNYVNDGNYDMVFSIYNVASAGTALWSTTHSGANAVPVTNGSFSVNIGSLDANGVNIAMDTPPYYLGIKVGTNAEMTPRIQLGFSPFAMTSKNLSNVYTDAAGNVGIGVTAPGAKLQIGNAGDTGNGAFIYGLLQTKTETTQVPFIRSISADHTSIWALGSESGDKFGFWRVPSGGSWSELVTINSSGNVGIGTTDPGTNRLYVSLTSDTSAALRVDGYGGNTGISKTAIISGNIDNGLAAGDTRALLSLVHTNPLGGSPTGRALEVKGSNGGEATTRDVFYVRVNGNTFINGNVGIGTISPQGKLDVAGTAYVTSGAWSGSDIRWKKNIVPLRDSLGKVLQLQGVSFLWNKEAYPDKGFTDGSQVGLIAQDVEKVVPEVVSTNIEGYKSLSYEKLTAVLIEAVKELKAENEQLRSRVSALEIRQY